MRTAGRGGRADAIGRQLAASYLSPPQPSAVMVERPRLLAKAVSGAPTPVTIVSGEPASGKTSLVLQLLASDALRDRAHIWLTVPPDTDDEIRFWEYLLAAIEVSAGNVQLDELRAALDDRQPPTDEWLIALANRLHGSDLDLVVVVDDLHELEAADAVASLGRLLDITPADIPVVVATRVLPTWPLAGWRMSGRLTEVTSRDLAVTIDEAHELLASNGIDVGIDDVVRLVERTEGWLGGVKLATLAIQRQLDPSELIARFSATDELVSTYLLRAVLDRQDGDVRRFLHDVAVLDTMSARLCDEIRQADDSAELLERCRAANLFVSKIGDSADLYHLHALVRDLLSADLQQRSPDRFVELHRRASRASEASGNTEQAIRHAIAAGDSDRAAKLVVAGAPELAHQTRFDELRRWAGIIRTAGNQHSHATDLALVSVLNLTGQGTEGLRMLDEIEAQPFPEASRQFLSIVRASCHMVRGDVHLLRHLGEQVQREAASEVTRDRGTAVGTALFFQGVGASVEGVFDDAVELLEAADLPEHRPAPPAYIAVKSWAAFAALRRGDTIAAEHLVDAATERRNELASGDSAAFATALLASAELAWERNRLDEASTLFTQARRSVSPMPWQAVLVECGRSRLTVSRGAPHEALRDLSEIGRLVLSSDGSPLLRALVAERSADIALGMGELDAALGWVHTHEKCRVGALPWATRIRVARATEPGTVAEVIAEARDGREPLPRRVDMLLAAADCTADDSTSRSYVAEALRLAEPGRLIRRFVDAGPRVAALVNELAVDPRRSGGIDFSRFFAAEIADACTVESTGRASPSAPVSDELVDQLSAREVEVLRLLDEGLSYTEIGSKLFVSRNTVKSHVQHIYTKLGTSGRSPAVEMGRRLGLIP